MNTIRTLTTTFAIGTLVATSMALAPAASAKGSDGVRASGSCSAGATSKIKAKHDDGRIEVEFEVDSNKVGQTWAVRIKDDGDRVFSGHRVTKAPSGSFSVEKRVPNRAGTDSFVAVAKNTKSGEKCTARVSL